MSKTTAKAIVAQAPGTGHTPGSNWHLRDISVPTDLKDGELLVEMAATGICHSDILITSVPAGTPGFFYPHVAGHKGSGYVKAIGPGVTKNVSVGDPVLLSFNHCGSCESCEAKHPAYCSSFMKMNILCQPDVFRSKEGEEGIGGKYFGQSSFASLSVVSEKSVLPAKGQVKTKEDLQLFAPLGCGIQTGAGAILNLAKPGPKDRVMVLGLGGVGLSAVMAAKTLDCEQIVAVDKVKSRIELAKELGATEGFDTTGVADLVPELVKVARSLGPTVIIDATGYRPLIQAAYDALASRGTFVFVGASLDPEYTIQIDIRHHLGKGIRLIGCTEGDSLPEQLSTPKAAAAPMGH